MADQDPSTRATATSSAGGGAVASTSIGDVIDTVKEYARQETVGPLKGAARWLAFGSAAAISLGIGTSLLVLALLRLLQHEFAPTFAGRWMSVVPYLVALVAAALVIGIAISRIGKKTLETGHGRDQK